MLKKLNNDQEQWVKHWMSTLSIEDKVGHLLCPEDRRYTAEDWKDLVASCHIGNAFFTKDTSAVLTEKIKALQAAAPLPLLIAGDLEHGNQVSTDTGTVFPYAMAQSATGDTEAAYLTGLASGREGRAMGVNWTYAPVVDLNYNFMNAVTMLRSYGDDPARTEAMARAFIRGIQEGGQMAAAAKHFPGDGVDNRDQHRVTSVNSLPYSQWLETYGKVWRGAIEEGVYTVMTGHIALPDYEIPGEDPDLALPGTLSLKLQRDLLRNTLGFQGLIVSDAAPMIGMTSRVSEERQAIEFILAGGDVFLFARPKEDYELLLQAVKDGEITEELLDDRVRRVLECKARLNLHEEDKVFGPPVTEDGFKTHQGWAKETAENALTVQRYPSAGKPELKKGDQVLVITVQRSDLNNNEDPCGEFVQSLTEKGYKVDSLYNPGHVGIRKQLNESDYAAVFVNIVIVSKACIGTHNLGSEIMNFWRASLSTLENHYFTSFGSPYLLREMPALPNLICTYSEDKWSQQAAASWWLGEFQEKGKCPVKLPKVKIAPLGELQYEMK